MFQSVRPNSQIYILRRNDAPKLEIGYVVNQPTPRPKYQIPQVFGQSQEMVVDLSVKINDATYNYTAIPATADVADSYSNGDNIIISDSRDAMTAEILNIKQKSIDRINGIDTDKKLVEIYDSILSDLNPEFAEKKAQKEELDGLKNQVNTMSESIAKLMETNRVLIEKLSLKQV